MVTPHSLEVCGGKTMKKNVQSGRRRGVNLQERGVGFHRSWRNHKC